MGAELGRDQCGLGGYCCQRVHRPPPHRHLTSRELSQVVISSPRGGRGPPVQPHGAATGVGVVRRIHKQSWSDSGSHPHSSSGQVQARGQGAFQPFPAPQTPLQKTVSRQAVVGRQGLGRSRSLGTTAHGDKVLTQPWSSPEEQRPPSPGTCPTVAHATSVITVFGPETHRSTLEKLTTFLSCREEDITGPRAPTHGILSHPPRGFLQG